MQPAMEMSKGGIDWAAIRTAGMQARAVASQELQRTIREEGTFDLEDVMLRGHEGGDFLMSAMARAVNNPSEIGGMTPRFRFRALYLDALGSVAKPGGKFKVSLGYKVRYWAADGQNRPMNSDRLASMTRAYQIRGREEDNPMNEEIHTLDEDCCFEVGFQTAHYLAYHHSPLGPYRQSVDVFRVDPSTKMTTGEMVQQSINWIVEYIRPGEPLPAKGKK